MSGLGLFLAGLAVGIAVGFGIVRWKFNDRGAKEKLEELQKEFDQYRSGVRSHFIDTVSLLSQIDERQQKLYNSITRGVQELCQSDSEDQNIFLENTARSLGQLTDATASADKKSE